MVMRRQLAWVNARSDFATLAGGAQTNMLLFNDATFGGRHTKGATVTRILAKVWMKNNAVAQANSLAWGITIVNADARAAGAFPDPADLGDRAGWLVRDWMLGNSDSLSDASQWITTVFDLRSQRILRNEEDELHLIPENTGSFTLQWAAFVRVLLKMPL